MKIGIKYCGGCNPKYDRADQVRILRETHPEQDWEYVKEEFFYDLLLVIGGCGSCCAGYGQYKYGQIRKLWEPEHFARLSEELFAEELFAEEKN